MAGKRTSIMLCLIQSGQTTWQRDERLRGATDLPLSDRGRLEIIESLPRLEVSRAKMICHPPDEAATDTAQLCAERLGAKSKSIEELADPNLGLLEGITQQQFEERFPSRFRQWEDDLMALEPPEGENLLHAADRIFAAVAKVLRRARAEEVAIVVHTLGIGWLRCWLADRPFNEARAMAGDRPSVERYAIPVEMFDALDNAVLAKT